MTDERLSGSHHQDESGQNEAKGLSSHPHGGSDHPHGGSKDDSSSMEHHSSMAMRGVTRPQMDMGEGHDGGDSDANEADKQEGHNDAGGTDHSMQEMTPQMREKMLQKHRAQTIWVPFLLILLGVWLVGSPSTFGYGSEPALSGVARVTSERDLAPIAARAQWMTWSDVISGILLCLFAGLWLEPRRWWAGWAACLVGVWLVLAPIFLWSPSPAAYNNDTLIGALVIALTILIPGMPGMIQIMKMGPEVPPGWSYNPSSWLQRGIVIILGWIGFFLSRHLAAYQLGYIDWVWEPIFADGTRRILESDVSRAWPVSDAGLGTVSYLFEALMGYMGGTARWRTMPWMVTFFGILVVPLGVTSIALVIMQPVMVGTWCTLCLATALAMLIMIPLTLDEVWAMGQFVQKKVSQGESFWRVFVLGGTIEHSEDEMKDARTPSLDTKLGGIYRASIWGVSVPWTLLLSALLGFYLMAAPAIFGTSGRAADSNHLVGALITVNAVIAMAEVARPWRFLNIVCGLWIAAAPLLLGDVSVAATISNIIVGLAVAALSVPRGPIRECYDGWDTHIR